MARTYFTLLVREEDQWTIAFGDWDKECVQGERDDMREGYQQVRAKNLKIISTLGGKQVDIQAQVDKLNQ